MVMYLHMMLFFNGSLSLWLLCLSLEYGPAFIEVNFNLFLGSNSMFCILYVLEQQDLYNLGLLIEQLYIFVCMKASLVQDIVPDWRGSGPSHAFGGFALIIKNHFYWDLRVTLVRQLNWDFIICCCWLFRVPAI